MPKTGVGEIGKKVTGACKRMSKLLCLRSWS